MWHIAFTITPAECVWVLMLAAICLGTLIGLAIARHDNRRSR